MTGRKRRQVETAKSLSRSFQIHGDPTFAGPLTGVQLGLACHHVVEPNVKEWFGLSVYDEPVSMLEMVLDADFVSAHKSELEANEVIGEGVMSRVKDGVSTEKVGSLIEDEGALGLYLDGKLVFCRKRSHEIGNNLSAEHMLENLASKATEAKARELLKGAGYIG